MANSRPAVLFDIDGTLVDSNFLHVYAWQRAFTEVGLPGARRVSRDGGSEGAALAFGPGREDPPAGT
jgi:beta-phosphoglucomutase-like phosphatase (HAD superfamily)